jgi:peptidoglycan/LPS O-acetylase OafA/YrhL
MTTHAHQASYLGYIDGLRAIAILAVITFHFAPDLLPGGYVGVDVFFVISGFVVANAAASRGDLTLAKFVEDFLARRIRRLVPALLVCLLATSLAAALWIPSSWLSDDIPRTGSAAVFGMSNVVLARSEGGYFSPVSSFNPFTHTWSLAVEEQFYLVMPPFLWYWLRGGVGRRFATCVFCVLVAGSLLLAHATTATDRIASYYLLGTRFWELGAGVALAVAMRRAGSRRRDDSSQLSISPGGWASWITLAMLVAFLAGAAPEHLKDDALIPVGATLILVFFLEKASRRTGLRAALECIALTTIGRLSYSLYLWHWPVIVLMRWTFGLSDAVHVTVATGAIALLSVISWRWIEQPFRVAVPGIRNRYVIGWGVMSLLAGSLAAQALHKTKRLVSPSVVTANQGDWYPSHIDKRKSGKGCSVFSTRVALSTGWRKSYARSECNESASAPDLFVIGDSHALAYGPMLARYTKETGANVTVYNNGGCPFVSLQPAREEQAPCVASRAAVMDDILKRITKNDVVFLPSLRMPRYVEQGWVTSESTVQEMAHGRDATEARDVNGMAMRQAAGLLGQLRLASARVVIQAPNLVLKAPAFRCADTWTRTNPICAGGVGIDREMFEALRAPALVALQWLADRDEGITLFDPVPSLCPRDTGWCDGFRDEHPLFFDGDHVSAFGNEVIYPAFLAAMSSPGTCPTNSCDIAGQPL